MPITNSNKEDLSNSINRLVVRGLKSGKKQRVLYQTRVLISKEMYCYLQKKFDLKFKFAECESLLREFKVIRANFTSSDNVSKCDAFCVALR